MICSDILFSMVRKVCINIKGFQLYLFMPISAFKMHLYILLYINNIAYVSHKNLQDLECTMVVCLTPVRGVAGLRGSPEALHCVLEQNTKYPLSTTG